MSQEEGIRSERPNTDASVSRVYHVKLKRLTSWRKDAYESETSMDFINDLPICLNKSRSFPIYAILKKFSKTF